MATDTDHSSDQSAAAAAIANDGNGGTSQPLQKSAPIHLSRRASTESSGGEGFVPILLPRSASGVSGASDASKMEALFNSKIAFPLALTHMLESVGELGLSHIVCWQDDEASFVIKDIDAFLADVLPKFFKASESTKIRSFYRKLNRWGFSMSRKTSNNPYNIWRHPDFNRADAVKSLKEAIDTGKPTDFLNMTLRGRMRREMEASFNSQQFIMGLEDDDSSSIASGHISNTSLNLLSHPRIASMPNMPMAKASSFSERKRWQFGKARTARQPQPSQQRKLSLTNYTPGAANNPNLGGLRGTQSMQIMGQGKANASFNLLQPMGGGDSNANATFDLIPPAAGASHANATFDLSLLTGAAGANTSGILPGMASTNGFAPSTNVFALSAQELLAACNPARNNIAEGQPAFADSFAPAPFAAPNDQAGSFGPGVTAPTATPNDNSGSFGPGITAPIVSPKPTNQSVPNQSVLYQNVPHQSIPHQNVPNQSVPNQNVHMQCDLTKEEDDELMDFFGEFAGTLPPPREDDEECAGEPNPLP